MIFNKGVVLKLVLLAFIIKVSFFLFNTYEARKYNPEQFVGMHFAMHIGDSKSYVDPINNYFNKGTYGSETAPGKFVLNGRAPYYGLFYGFFKLFFGNDVSLDLLMIFQLIMEIISCVIFFHLVLRLSNNQKAAWIGFFCYCLLSWLSNYTNKIMTESLSLSFFVSGLSCFVFYLQTGRRKYFIISSLLFSYLACMRPFLLPALAIFVFVNLYRTTIVQQLKKRLMLFVTFFIPLFLLLTPWTIRNYIVSREIIPFQESVNAGYEYSASDLSLRYFLTAVGENFIFWNYKAAGSYFDPVEKKLSTYEIPNSILCDGVTKEKIEKAKYHYQRKCLYGSKEDERIADSMFVKMREDFIAEKPFYYYVISPFKVTYYAYVHNGVEFLYRHTWYELAYKVMQSALFVLISIGFLLAVLLRKIKSGYFIYLLPLLLTVVMCFGFRFCEKRYFLYAYPVFIFYASVVMEMLLRKIRTMVLKR